ncbi:MAG: ATP-binding protein, partial [Bacteroidota bacterium]
QLLIGTISGLNIIDPQMIKRRWIADQALKVYLTALRYPDPSSDGTIVQLEGLEELKTVELPATNRFLTLTMATSNYFKPEENQYAYKLEGIDSEWTDLGNQHILNLNNLPSGNYRLLLRANDGSGNWTPTPLSIDINAQTIFYKQLGFYLLLASLFFGGAFLWITRLRKFVKKATEEIQEDKEIIEQQAINERIKAKEMEQQAWQIEQQAQKLSQSLIELQTKNDQILITQNRLIQQEKLASLGQLTAGIAHEIKNPLNFINNFAEGSIELLQELLSRTEKNTAKLPLEELNEMKYLIEDLMQNALDIKGNGHRLDRIVRSMMDHARGTNQENRSLDINQLVDDNINLAYHGYRALEPSFNVQIQKSFSEKIPEVLGYPQELGRVILNLLNNAFYVVNEKSKATRTYHPTVKIDTQLIDANGQGKFAAIKIWDNGMGIPKEVQDKIFNPFFTTKSSGKGNTGLGLSISYDIISKQHQGQLLVESEPGEYTQFTSRLPINE